MSELVEKYQFLVAKGSDNLSEKVNEALEQGWELYGDPVISQSYQGLDDKGNPKVLVLCGQAMVVPFYEDNEELPKD